MTPHFQRGTLLAQQSRWLDAARELKKHLAEQPADPAALGLFALCLVQIDKFDEAEAAVRRAVARAPDEPDSHYYHAIVLRRRGRFREAEAAARTAVRLDPESPQYFSQLSATLFVQEKWEEALAAADAGLALDAEHVQCLNFRTMALTHLGSAAQAVATVDATLAANPEDAFSHANKGWALLHQNRPAPAADHFRESMRLDPTCEYARAGLVEATKARNPVYRIVLKYFLWMSRLDSRARWGVILGGYFAARTLTRAARHNPSLAPWVVPLLILYALFVLTTWFAVPMSNLLLRLSRDGRLMLDGDERASAHWFAGCMTTMAVGSIGGYFADSVPLLVLGAVGFGLALPATIFYRCDQGWPRNVMRWIAVALAAVGLAWVGVAATESSAGDDFSIAFKLLGIGFMIGALGIVPWTANALVNATAEK
ncbi:MAG: tetratricopeptide repeat protein [Pirellulales bacterium]|nr:tetratricopeptide repeat protein [Pirellulales bacterium]